MVLITEGNVMQLFLMFSPKSGTFVSRGGFTCGLFYNRPNVYIFTGRNEVVAKVMFLQVCVCPQGGRVSASVHAGMPYPPRWRTPPDGEPPQMETPLDGEPPRMENPLDGEPPQMENPPWMENPPDGEPPGMQTPAYHLQAANTHPTGMHSCF